MTETQRLTNLIGALMDAWAEHRANDHDDNCGWCLFERAFHERTMKSSVAESVLAPKEPCGLCPSDWTEEQRKEMAEALGFPPDQPIHQLDFRPDNPVYPTPDGKEPPMRGGMEGA